MSPPPFALHGPADVRTPLVLDSPHSGAVFPADFGAALDEAGSTPAWTGGTPFER